MSFVEFLRKYLGMALITKLVEARKPVSSVIFDRVFTRREARATARVSLAQIQRVTKSMPVISRGGQAIPLDPKNAALTLIEPLSIRLSDLISGARLNDLRSLYGTGDAAGQALVSAEVDKIVTDLMRSTELTRNALLSQALSGKIDYVMDSNGMKERYIIDYGTPQTHSLSVKLDDQNATIADLTNTLMEMQKKISDAGYAGTPIVLAGTNAFSTITNLIMVTDTAERMGATVSGNTINILGYEINLVNSTYQDADSSGKPVSKTEIDTNMICMLIPEYTELDYCAIDDIQGGLQATPFFSKAIDVQDPSGINIISESKPLPLVAPQSICWAEVTTSMGRRTKLTINVSSAEGKVYTQKQLEALTKVKILEIASERGYEMAETSESEKPAIITEFLEKQTAVNSAE